MMRKILAMLLLAAILTVFCANAFAATMWCKDCAKIVVGKESCSGNILKPIANWQPCTRGNGCLNYRFLSFQTKLRCPTHSSVTTLSGSHTERTDHEYTGHNRRMCPY